MRSVWISIIALLVSVFGGLTGSGVLTTLVPVRAASEGFARFDIGIMGSSYFGGMLLGAIIAPGLVRRFGSVPTYAGSLVLAIVVLLTMPVLVSPWSWILLRGLTGLSLAGNYAVVEGYLQASAENRYRGRLLAAYSVMQYGGWAVGGQLMRAGDPMSSSLFLLAAFIVGAVGLLPLVLVKKPRARTVSDGVIAPRPPRGMDLAGLYRTSPVGFVTVILIGAVNGPFWTLTPVYATDVGLTAVATGTLMTLIAVGAALFQLPVGKLSDAVDRRAVIVGLALAASAIEIVLAIAGAQLVVWPLMVFGLVLGGLIGAQYYTTAAHTNDRAGPERAVSIASALLFLYSIGAVTGPLTAAYAMQAFGPGALHGHNALLHAALAAFVLQRMVSGRRGSAGSQDNAAIDQPAATAPIPNPRQPVI
jgi:MFS family permease